MSKDNSPNEPWDFLAALSAQVPDVWEQTVRYLGKYSARTRGAERARVNSSNDKEDTEYCDEEEPEPTPKASSTWAMLIRKVYEVDPLMCPKCQTQIKIVAFLQNPKEIEKLCHNLDIEASRDPPPFENSLGVHLVPDFEQTIY